MIRYDCEIGGVGHQIHGFHGHRRFALSDFIVVVHDSPFLTHFFNVLVSCDHGAEILTIGRFGFAQLLKVTNPFQQKPDVDMLVGLISSHFDLLAILPVRLTAEDIFQPIVQHILQVHAKMKVFFLGLVLVSEGEGFAHEQFIPILIEGHQEKGEKGNDQAKQPSNV